MTDELNPQISEDKATQPEDGGETNVVQPEQGEVAQADAARSEQKDADQDDVVQPELGASQEPSTETRVAEEAAGPVIKEQGPASETLSGEEKAGDVVPDTDKIQASKELAAPSTVPPDKPYTQEVKADISQNMTFTVLAYLSLLCLVVLALKSRSRFAAFHARQGLLIMIIQFLSLYAITFGTFGILIMGATFGFSLIGVLEVLSGNYWEFPFLGKLAQKLTFL